MIALAPKPASAARAFLILVRWRILAMRMELPQLVFIQVVFATGMAIGMGFLIPDIDAETGAYLATGALLINLLMIAVVVVPGVMAEAKTSGALDYMWSLPFPRLAYISAELAVWSAAALPGMVVSLVITAWRYDFELAISPLVLPAVALILFSGSTIGTAIGLRAPSQQAANLFANFIIVAMMLFSPVNFPADRLPGWMQAVHDVLPIASMADLVRATLVDVGDADVGRALAVVGLWSAAGIAATLRSVSRVR